ncbi:MAG: hypothetical protein BGO88_00030 [Flavobacterium sp. 38-13]|nr:MAG: hypothetical protein BGO88_00030 [Flavobacterium sp. 38-13]
MSQKDFIMKQLFLILLLYSTGVMSQNTAINTGINTKNPGSRLTVNGSFAGDYKIVSGDVTLDDSDFYIAFNGIGRGTILLPKAISGPGNFKGRIYGIKNISAQGELFVFSEAPSLEKIDATGDVDYIVVPPGYYAELISKGTTTGTTWELSMLAPTKLSSKMTRLLNVAIGVPKNSSYQSLFTIGPPSSLDVVIPGSRGSFFLTDDNPRALFLNFTVGLALVDSGTQVFPPGSVISYYRCELFVNDMPTGIFQVVQENSKGLQFNLSGKYNFVPTGWWPTIHAKISAWNSFGSANNHVLGVLSILLSVDSITRT